MNIAILCSALLATFAGVEGPDWSLAEGDGSFTVSCRTKTDDVDYIRFVGTRTVAQGEKHAGWVLGMIRGGYLVATVADGTNKFSASCLLLNAGWSPEEWNHLTMVRDAAAGTVSLYVNGLRVARRVGDVRTIRSRGPVKSGGDSWCGGRFTGEVKDFDIVPCALKDADVARLAGANYQSPEPAPVLSVQPQPRQFERSDVAVDVPQAFVVDAAAIADAGVSARELSENRLQKAFAMKKGQTGLSIVFVRQAKAHPEEFSIEGRADGENYRVVIAADGAGWIYGFDAVEQLMRVEGLKAGGERPRLPRTFRMRDWPSIANRIVTTGFGSLWAAKRFDGCVERLARERHNWIHLSGREIKEGYLRQFCSDSGRYGLKIIYWNNLCARPFGEELMSPDDSESIKPLEDTIALAARAGVKGFAYTFDDLTGKYLGKNGYPTVGAYHNALVMKALEIERQYGKFDYHVAIPFLYCRDWVLKGDGENYYSDFTRGFEANGVRMCHTVVLAEDVAKLRRDGAETYGYFMNGMWPTPQFFTWYAGQPRLAWTWNMFEVERNGRGPRVSADALRDMRSLAERSDVFYGAASGGAAQVLQGILAWRPEAFDEDAAGVTVAQSFYGAGVYGPLKRYEKALGPIIATFRSYKTVSSNEAKVKETVVPVGDPERRAALLAGCVLDAEQALDDVKAAIAAQKTVLQRPSEEDRRRILVTEMEKSLAKIRPIVAANLHRRLPAEATTGEWRPKERWRGFNLLGMFCRDRVGKDSRVPGFFSEDHFRWMKQWGFNFARLPLDYRLFVKDGDWMRLDETRLAKLDQALAYGRKYGIHVQINFHRAPGFCVNAPKEAKCLFRDPEPLAAFLSLWTELARRYKDRPNEEVSFDLYNEPTGDVDGSTRDDHVRVSRLALEAIRKVDSERFVIVDGWAYGTRPFPEFYGAHNVGESIHAYQPMNVSHCGISWLKNPAPPVWPPEAGKPESGREFLDRVLYDKWRSAEKAGAFLMVGEFGLYCHTPAEVGYRWIEDNLRIWKEKGWGWCLWNLDGAFGIVDSGHEGVKFEDFEGHKLDRRMLDLLQRY